MAGDVLSGHSDQYLLIARSDFDMAGVPVIMCTGSWLNWWTVCVFMGKRIGNIYSNCAHSLQRFSRRDVGGNWITCKIRSWYVCMIISKCRSLMLELPLPLQIMQMFSYAGRGGVNCNQTYECYLWIFSISVHFCSI